MKANKYQVIYYMEAALKEKYSRERASLIVEIYGLKERFAKFLAKAPEGTENAFQDKIDITEDELTRLDEKHQIALELLNKISGGVLD